MRSQDKQEVTTQWDAGDIGCGHLAAGLARALSELSAGQSLWLITSDAGAPIDVPAWCRMTKHSLISATHPNYIICKKGN